MMMTGDQSKLPISRIGAWAGMIGPLLFFATFTAEGWLRPGYSSTAMFVSALSLGPRGWVQIANFMILGTAIFLLSLGLAADFDRRTLSRAGPLLLAAIGFGFFASGPFVMDAGANGFADMSRHSQLHHLFGALVFSLSPVSCFVFFHAVRADSEWHQLRLPSLFAGTAMTLGVVLMKTAELVARLTPWRGLVQRLTLVSYLLWLVLLGFALLKRSTRRTRQAPHGLAKLCAGHLTGQKGDGHEP
jgi:Protein of unknown function (DUF998)